MIRKIAKPKPYKPVLCLQDRKQGFLFEQVLEELITVIFIHDDIESKIMRDFFKDFLGKHIKRLLTGDYPLQITFKRYEALLFYKAVQPRGYSVHFQSFINQINQYLVV